VSAIILKMVLDLKCQGCGATDRHIDKKSLLCLYCLSFQLEVWRRKQEVPLEEKMRQRFGVVGARIREQLAEFNKTTS